MSAKRIYQRGEFWLDYCRGKGGKPVSSNLYIWWYSPEAGKQRRKSTRSSDIRVASAALDAHYLASHEPTAADQQAYSVLEALVDYYLLHGQKQVSAESIRARLKLVRRFIELEFDEGRIREPFLPAQLNAGFIERFRTWALNDPIVARKKNDRGEWIEVPIRRRSAATVEEAVIQLKAALNYAEDNGRIAAAPKIKHRTRGEVTPPRTYRLSIDGLAELLDFSASGAGKYAGHANLLIPLRRYLIGAICTLARPDAVLDMNVRADRGQWMRLERRFDLNPAGRLQTKKHRPVLPVCDLLNEWLCATDEFLVCRHTYRPIPGNAFEEEATQLPVASVRSGWDTMRGELKLPYGWGPKLIRHSMATILANRRVSMLELEITLGHRPLSKTTDRYVIFSPDYLQSVLAGIDDVVRELTQKCPHALIPPSQRRLRTSGLNAPWIRSRSRGNSGTEKSKWSPPGIPISAKRHQYFR